MIGRGLVFTGARARLSMEGTKIMYATNVSYGEEVEHLPLEVLDQFEVAEWVPVAYRVSFGAQMARVVGNPVKNRDGVKLFPRVEDILSSPEMTAQIEDSPSGTIVANVERIKCTGYDVPANARGLVMQDLRFVAIRVRDESEIK